MPAQSKSQQRFFGVVKAMQKGDIPKKGKAGKIAKTMDKDDVDDFASTKHKGKPEKVKREQRVRNLIKKMVREIMNETLPNKVTDKFKNLKDQPKSKVAKDFQKQHSTSMADGKQGTIAEPDTYDWDDDMNDEAGYQGDEKDKKKYGYEPVKEDFAGAYPKNMRKKFDNKRKKQSEVLGYKLTGKDDIKTEIDDATVKEGRGPCWVGYTQKGMKKKGDRMVPNCVKNEEKIKEDFKNNKWEVYVADENGKEKIVKVAKSKRAGVILYNRLINTDKYHEVGMRVIKEGKLIEGKGVDKVLSMANDNSFGKLGGKTVDAMSANLFKTVYDKLTGSNKEKIDKMNEKQLYVFMTKLWTKFGKQVRI